VRKILFFGPYSPPVTGQSQAFKTVVDSYSENEYYLVDTTKYKYRFINTLFSIYRSLWLLVTERSISVIYFTCSRSVWGAIRDVPMLLLAGYKGTRVINHLHGADFRDFYENSNKLVKSFIRRSYNNIDTSIVLTTAMTREFEAFHSMKKEVVSNFYPKDFDEQALSKKGKLMITFLSNIRQSKGILEFLNAAKVICNSKSDIFFQVAGDYMSDHLMTTSEITNEVVFFMKTNQHLSIEFIGKLTPEERFEFLNKSEIFVLPTYYPTEAFPLTIIEAMRCGNVIITTDHNYLPEIINSNNGSIVAPGNVGEIVDAILRYAEDKTLMKVIQEYNISEAKSKYSEENYVSSVKYLIGV
jgi:glycosyltransferase involved in cell wall biosynthesis